MEGEKKKGMKIDTEKVEWIMADSGMSYTELADKIGISPVWLYFKIRLPVMPKTFKRIAQALDVSVIAIIDK